MSQRQANRVVGVRIAGSGVAIPSVVVTNHDLAEMVDTSDEWITQRTGIEQRRRATGETTMRSLARDAVAAAVADAGIEPGDLDMLILATMSPEMPCPATAARVVHEIGASPAGAVDISAACSGFVYGMNMAAGLLQTGMYQHIAVVGAEKMSEIINWQDRGTCILFGDGAGAAVFSATDNVEQGCMYQSMASDGGKWNLLYVPMSKDDLPADGEGAEFNGKLGTVQMNGREIYKFAVTTLMRTLKTSLKACDLKPDDLAMIIAHQSNARILESAREKLGLPEEKLYINIDKYGNTSAASVPICLHELRAQGRLTEGDHVAFLALGGGLTWTCNLWRM